MHLKQLFAVVVSVVACLVYLLGCLLQLAAAPASSIILTAAAAATRQLQTRSLVVELEPGIKMSVYILEPLPGVKSYYLLFHLTSHESMWFYVRTLNLTVAYTCSQEIRAHLYLPYQCSRASI